MVKKDNKNVADLRYWANARFARNNIFQVFTESRASTTSILENRFGGKLVFLWFTKIYVRNKKKKNYVYMYRILHTMRK